MTVAYSTIEIAKLEALGMIRLNRPRVLNAINNQMLSDIDRALDDLEGDDAVRVIAITGTGRAFSAGRDLNEVGSPEHRSGATVWHRIEACRKPVIAGVNGVCFTGALSLVLCCDLIVASEDAVFADTHAKYGMFHGGGTSQRLRDVLGPVRAKELLLTCERIGAIDAERIGLVNRVVPPSALEDAIIELARKIAENDAAAIASVKSLINAGERWGTAVGMEMEEREYSRQQRERLVELREKTHSFFERKEHP